MPFDLNTLPNFASGAANKFGCFIGVNPLCYVVILACCYVNRYPLLQVMFCACGGLRRDLINLLSIRLNFGR